MTAGVELLTLDPQTGEPIQGQIFPLPARPVQYLESVLEDWVSGVDPPEPEIHAAYPCRFFRLDEHRQPMPETVVTFLVPSEMLVRGMPTEAAMRAVSKRMGWT